MILKLKIKKGYNLQKVGKKQYADGQVYNNSFDVLPSKLYPFKVKVAEAFACVDEKEIGTLDIDDIGKLLEASGKPLPGKLSIV